MPRRRAPARLPVVSMRVKWRVMAQLPFERPRAELMRSQRGWLIVIKHSVAQLRGIGLGRMCWLGAATAGMRADVLAPSAACVLPRDMCLDLTEPLKKACWPVQIA